MLARVDPTALKAYTEIAPAPLPEASEAIERLRDAGLRLTRQRQMLVRLLFKGTHRRVCAEELHAEALAAGIELSLATVYNTLKQLCEVGLLRRAALTACSSYYDTDTSNCCRYFLEDEGRVLETPAGAVRVRGLPVPPEGHEITHVEVVVRVRRARPGR